jgi:K(+)-stimulated pyrophosphate-energized sodium pump
MIDLSGSNLVIVAVIAVVALCALGVAAVLVRQVLSADPGTEKMQEIAGAVQEGAAAYLSRQFRTLSVFAVIVFFMLFLLPADSNGERIGRSVFFLVGAVFSATTGYMGMWLAVRGNVRVASAAREPGGEQIAMKIAFRTGGVAGMFTVGLGLFGAALVVLVARAMRSISRASGRRACDVCASAAAFSSVRRRCRPGRQGRGRHPRRRSAQSGRDCRQRGRQRR